tara:strand:+ start:3184 stop:3600 length:417 start_codon:yes stop_codon:yes gene_type:complete
MSEKQPNWDKITEGKIRHGFAIEAFKKDMKLSEDLMKDIDRWVYFVVHGLSGLKEIIKMSKDTKKMSHEELVDEVKDKFDGEDITPSSEDYIKEQIEKAIVVLDRKNQNKVLYQLKKGKITMDNLQACLEKINSLAKP